MADLKSIDEASLTSQLEACAEQARDSISREAAECIRQVTQAARALAAMPSSTTDLVNLAEYLLVDEVAFDKSSYVSAGCSAVSVEVVVPGNRVQLHSARLRESVNAFPSTRYRVIVALIPIGK